MNAPKDHIAFRRQLTAGDTAHCVGIFDALSARVAEDCGFSAVMTGGYSMTASLLGKPDAGLLTMTESVFVVRNVSAAVSVPVVADIDTGFGNAVNLQRTIRETRTAGAAAIILEDQVFPKRSPSFDTELQIVPVEEAVGKIEAAVAARGDDEGLTIIARTDATDQAEAIRRGEAYARAGADLIQPISRTFRDFAGLRALRDAVGVPLSLQLLGWLETDLTRQQIQSVAGLATWALVPVLTVSAALRANLTSIANSWSSTGLPIEPDTTAHFGAFIGKGEIDEVERRFVR